MAKKNSFKTAFEEETDPYVGFLKYRSTSITGSTFTAIQVLLNWIHRTEPPATKFQLMSQSFSGQKQLQN